MQTTWPISRPWNVWKTNTTTSKINPAATPLAIPSSQNWKTLILKLLWWIQMHCSIIPCNCLYLFLMCRTTSTRVILCPYSCYPQLQTMLVMQKMHMLIPHLLKYQRLLQWTHNMQIGTNGNLASNLIPLMPSLYSTLCKVTLNLAGYGKNKFLSTTQIHNDNSRKMYLPNIL